MTRFHRREAATLADYVAVAVSLGLLVVGFNIGYAIAPTQDAATRITTAGTWLSSFAGILMRNVGALFLIFSGSVTGGLVTLLAWPLVAVYIGATWKLSEAVLGRSEALSIVLWYAPLEFAALALAAAAGLLPMIAMVVSALSSTSSIAIGRRPLLTTYLRAIPSSLILLYLAGSALVCAAAIEATVIEIRYVHG